MTKLTDMATIPFVRLSVVSVRRWELHRRKCVPPAVLTLCRKARWETGLLRLSDSELVKIWKALFQVQKTHWGAEDSATVRSLSKELSLTQPEVARPSGVTQGAVSRACKEEDRLFPETRLCVSRGFSQLRKIGVLYRSEPGLRGSLTDRGRIYIVYGPPDAVHRESRNGIPEEIWRYEAFTRPGQLVGIEGKFLHAGNKVVLDFLDDCRCNDYRLKSPEPK